VISVVIPALNAEDTLAQQLAALAGQRRPASWSEDDWEVIVADNGSTDGTVDLAVSWADRLPVRAVDASARPGAAAARNIGAQAARGSTLAFVDADDVALDGWLLAVADLDTTRRDDAVFATGPISRFVDGSRPDPDGPGALRPPIHLGFLPYAYGANLVISGALFRRHAGFDEGRRTGEDVDLSWRLQLSGIALESVPALRMAVRERSEGWAVFRQTVRYGRGDVALARDYRPLGLPRQDFRRVLRTYAGIVARLPLLFIPKQRRRWVRQLGRRVGRLSGWWPARTILW
jgi:glycosyltransferase involved in cell wall biosynthesis